MVLLLFIASCVTDTIKQKLHCPNIQELISIEHAEINIHLEKFYYADSIVDNISKSRSKEIYIPIAISGQDLMQKLRIEESRLLISALFWPQNMGMPIHFGRNNDRYLINKSGRILNDGHIVRLSHVDSLVKRNILNNGLDPDLSDKPNKANMVIVINDSTNLDSLSILI